MMNRRLCAAVVAAAAMLAVPGAASAAVTIGSTDPTGVADDAPGAFNERTVVQTASPPAGTSYKIPDGNWAVKSVAARLGSGQSGTAAVRFARPQNGTYLWLGTEPLQVTQTAEPTVFTADVLPGRKLKGGDLLGLTFGGDAQAYSDNSPNSGYTWASVEDDPIDGTEVGLTPGQPDGPYAISATLEPDEDQDGYGDETQDACPKDAERQEAPCATDLKVSQAVSATTIPSGGQLSSTFLVSNLGPAKAVNVRLQSAYGQYLFHKSWPAFCENLPGQTFCKLGDIEPGQTVIVASTVGAVEVKGPVSEARGGFVVSDNRELDKSNNSAVDVLINVVPTGGPGVTPPPPPGTCRAPKLRNKTLARAKTLIRSAKCALGKVTKPKRKLRKGYRLVVKTQRPAAGAVLPLGTKINLTMKAARKKR